MSDDVLTRLRAIEQGVIEIRTEQKRDREETRKMLRNHDRVLFGDGSDDNAGLKMNVALLKSAEARRTWQFRTMWGAVTAAIVGAASSFFKPN